MDGEVVTDSDWWIMEYGIWNLEQASIKFCVIHDYWLFLTRDLRHDHDSRYGHDNGIARNSEDEESQ